MGRLAMGSRQIGVDRVLVGWGYGRCEQHGGPIPGSSPTQPEVGREDKAETVALVASQPVGLDTADYIQLYAGSKDTLGRGGGAT